MTSSFKTTMRPLAASALALLICGALSGCATTGQGTSATGEKALTPAQLKQQKQQANDLINQDPVAAAAYWGSLYDSDTTNVDTIVHYTAALRQIGSLNRALEVLSTAARLNASSSPILTEYGKTLIAVGKAADAAPVLDRASEIDPKNWAAFSAAGIAQDHLGNPQAAQSRYEAALALKHDNAATLNNYALSRTLAGDLPKAEDLLRQAVKIPDSGAKIRQNLALVLGLEGKFAEAEQIARGDLIPADVKNNMEYIRSLIGQSGDEQSLKSSGNAG